MIAEILASLAAIVSVVVAAIALWVAYRQFKEARKTRDVSALMPIYQLHESADSIKARQLIYTQRGGFNQRNPSDQLMLHAYISELNFLASLVIGGLLDEKKAEVIFGNAVTSCWKNCRSTIINDIRQDEKSFAENLENVAAAWSSAKFFHGGRIHPQIRAWAKSQKMEVSAKGRVSKKTIAAYDQAPK